MGTHIIKLNNILSSNDRNLIKQFCRSNSQNCGINVLATFLKKNFSINVSTDQDIISGFAVDSSNLKGYAEGLCRPNSTKECSIIFSICFNCRIPVTITGGQTNLTGSATPNGGLLLSTVNLTHPPILVDIENKTVSAPTGVILEEIRNEVLKKSFSKLIYPVDPTSREDAFVGGTLSTNASGFIPGKKGATRKWVKEIEIVMPNGMIARAQRGQFISNDGLFILKHDNETTQLSIPTYSRPKIKNASGPYSSKDGQMDFVDLIIGSEGIFGLITHCSLKLDRRPTDYLDLFLTIPNEEIAFQLLISLENNNNFQWDSVKTFEYFGYNCMKYMNNRELFFSDRNSVGVYIKIPIFYDNYDEVATKWLKLLQQSISSFSDDNVKVLQDSHILRKFFEARHSMPAKALEIVRRNDTVGIITDTIVPPEYFNKFVQYSHKLLQSKDIEYLLFGHLGDCHLHFHILPTREQQIDADICYQLMIEKSAELGGVYSAEHGTGKRKRTDFLKCYGQEAVEQVRKTKSCIDPYFLLNRGNVIDY